MLAGQTGDSKIYYNVVYYNVIILAFFQHNLNSIPTPEIRLKK